MSKELVISSNRHETRVAVLEDDQVVEIYHQRENEYSLAGSIHKGRVTRVLPGMQSAFVDIGLGRDAFLYVSDFFEDNEEYDKIVTAAEEKVLKLDRPAAAPAAAAAEPVSEAPATGEAPAAASSTDAAASAPLSPPASAMIGPAADRDRRPGRDNRGGENRGGEGREGRESREGRGRRSRRGRGGRGGDRGRGGLPESKFYSPRTDEARSEAGAESRGAHETPTAEATSPSEDFLLLPGESLAKYVLPGESLAKYSSPGEESPHAVEAAAHPEPSAHVVAPEEVEPEEVETEAEAAEEAAAAEEPVPAAPTVEAAELTPETALAREAVEEARADERQEEAEKVVAAEAAVSEAPQGEQPAVVSVTLAEIIESHVEEPAEDAGDTVEAAEAGEEPAEGEAAPVEEGVLAMEEEGPEPARIPTSLTATLREQGQRQHLHRISRRTRRRGRGGDRGDRGDRGQAPDGQQRPAQEGRPPQEARPAQEGREVRPEQQRQREAAPQRERREDRAPLPSISDLLREGQEIIVQIAKEPLGQKGARITSHIALPGRFLVYMPTVDHIGVSRKIPSDDERLRLKRILQANRTGVPGGYIVRTAGDGRTEEELRADMMFLYNMWLDMRQKAERRSAPVLIHHDLNVVERILRDQLTPAYKNVWVDNEEVYESVLRFVQRFQPALVNRVKLYTRSVPLFDEYGVTAELEKALRPKVWLKSGGYIVINQTEALVAIDINTGKYVGKSNRLEDTIVKTNTDAIKEIVRQIRLRDLGGIIVVDFIDMDERKNRQKVMQALEEAMRADRAPYKILQFNDFGLVAITRKRVKQSLERTLCCPCPYCEGAGYVKSPQTVVGEILQEAHKIAKAVEGNDVMLRVAPEVAKLLKSNQNTYLPEIEEILGGRTVIVKSDPLLHQEKFDLA
jgi:ribonuclease G